MSSVMRLLGRGVAAGTVAGLLSGGFSWFLVEPLMDRAVRREPAREVTVPPAHAGQHAEIFSRATQHAGLLVATTVTGLALGLLFAVVHLLLHRRAPETEAWRRALRLAAAGFTGVWLLPFVRYPSNPPGVGDPGTVGLRTQAWLGAIAISLIGVVLAWALHDHLARRGHGAPARQLCVAGVLGAATAALFALPDNPDALAVPAGELWDFRLWSVATALVLWAALGTAFGLLGERAARRSPRTAPHGGSIRVRTAPIEPPALI
ncbi:CbtA family protein [Streptomyces sp. NPDC052727]|uniref:CbtA family protein n=1 Tax=Streptomyces sp. NPDC052727 TaxID=3154854 RepID=UPI00342E7698